MKLSRHCALGEKLKASLAVQPCVLQFFFVTACELFCGAKDLNVPNLTHEDKTSDNDGANFLQLALHDESCSEFV